MTVNTAIRQKNVSAMGFGNPKAKDGKAAGPLSEIENQQRELYPDLIVIDKSIPDPKDREAYHAEQLDIYKPSVTFSSGGDGTFMGLANLLFNLSRQPISRQALHKLKAPEWLKAMIGVGGAGSAEDVGKMLGFPHFSALLHFLLDETNHHSFKLAVVFSLIPQEGQSDLVNPEVINHSWMTGFVSKAAWERHETQKNNWRQKPGNQDKPVPFWHSSLFGRTRCFIESFFSCLIRDGVDLFAKLLGANFNWGDLGDDLKSLTLKISHQKAEADSYSEPITVENVQDFAVFCQMMAAGAIAIPHVYPLAGPECSFAAMALPKSYWMGPTMVVEGIIRGALAKIGIIEAVGPGPHSDFLTLSALEYLGFWKPEYIQKLSHGDRLKVEFFRRIQEDGKSVLKPHYSRPVINGDLSKPTNVFELYVGTPEQTLPVMGSKKSVQARVEARVNAKRPQPPNSRATLRLLR